MALFLRGIRRPGGEAVEVEHDPESNGGSSQSNVVSGHGDPEPPGNAVQQLSDNTSSGIDSGTFKIVFESVETAEIDYRETDLNDVLAMLQAIPALTGNISLSGGAVSGSFWDNGELDVEFVGDLAFQEVPLLTVTNLNFLSDGEPVDSADFAWDVYHQGTPGNPSNFASALLYVDKDTNATWANVNYPSEESPNWQIAIGFNTIG